MKTTQHGDNLIQLTRLGAFNCYLVREDDGFTLVDASLPNSAAGILAAAERQQQPIKRVVLTHAHLDHVGSLDEVCGQLPEVEVAFSARTARFLAGDLSLEADEPQTKLKGSFTTRQTQATRLLNPDDTVGSLQVIAAPGHTPDQIVFFDQRDGTLLAGDAFQTQGGIAVAGMLRWLFPFPAMATWHRSTALKTARALHDLKPARLAVGHGQVIKNPVSLMAQAISAAERRWGNG